jgi:hypothetical protein
MACTIVGGPAKSERRISTQDKKNPTPSGIGFTEDRHEGLATRHTPQDVRPKFVRQSAYPRVLAELVTSPSIVSSFKK